MAKKDFSTMNTDRAETAGSGAVMKKLIQGASNKGQQGEATPEEAAARLAELRTQGRKGCRLTRINTAFSPENHEYIKVMAKISGKTMTEFINYCIEQYRNEHPELYAQARQIIDSL